MLYSLFSLPISKNITVITVIVITVIVLKNSRVTISTTF